MSQIAFSFRHASPSRIFLWMLVGIIIGVAGAPYLPRLQLLPYLLVGLVCSAFLILRTIRVIALLLMSIGIGWWRYDLLPTQSSLIGLYDRSIEITGTISAETDRRVDRQRLTISSPEHKTKILITVPLYPVLRYGDVVTTRCMLRQPGLIDDFQYDRYLALSGISGYCSAPSVMVTDTNAQPIVASLYAFKLTLLTRINQLIPEPEASFAAGLLLGVRRSIPEEVQTAFNRTGTTHIIAISGYNITLIATIFQAMLFPWLGRKRSFWFVVIALTLFVILTGASASVVRAGVMGVIVLLSRRLGRTSRMSTALVLAAVVMILVNPLVLRDDKGFQLSFLATIGLVYLSPQLERWTRWVTTRFGLRESLTATLASTIATLPLIAVTFGRLSVVAVLANMLILPMIPVAMACSFAMVVGSMLWPALGSLLSWLAWATLHYVIVLTGWLSGFEWSSIDIPAVPWWVTIIGFSILVWIIVPRLELLRPAMRGFRYER